MGKVKQAILVITKEYGKGILELVILLLSLALISVS